MSSNQLVTIVIPAFNAEKTLDRCVQSLAAQSHGALQIIIVDNGSTDRTPDLLLEYTKGDSRIFVAKEEKQGPSAARNTGLGFARGDYVCFCDADDFYDKSYVEVMLSNALASKADIVVCGYRYISKSHKVLSSKTPPSGIDASPEEFAARVILDQRVMGSVCNKMYSHSAVDKVRFDATVAFCEDTLFNVEVARYINKVQYVEDVLYNYVLEDESLTRTNPALKKEKASQLLKDFSETFKRYRNTPLSDSVDAAKFSLSVRERIAREIPKAELAAWARSFFRSGHVSVLEKIKIALKLLIG